MDIPPTPDSNSFVGGKKITLLLNNDEYDVLPHQQAICNTGEIISVEDGDGRSIMPLSVDVHGTTKAVFMPLVCFCENECSIIGI